MNKLLAMVIAGTICVGSAFAAPVNITTFDGRDHIYGTSEDQEWEKYDNPDSYDLEAFLWDNGTSTLSIVSQFNFATGVGDVTGGDLFLDLNSDGGKRPYSFDYGIKLNFDDNTFDLYSITNEDLILHSPNDQYHNFANPFQFNTATALYKATGNLEHITGLTDTESEFRSRDGSVLHNRIDLDFGDVGITGPFSTFITMSCANDMMVGKVPEPAILSLLGISLIGMSFIRRKK